MVIKSIRKLIRNNGILYSIFNNLRTLIKQCRYLYCNIIFFLCKVFFKIDNKKIICSSYSNTRVSCNPKYITQHILDNYPSGTYDIVWILNDLYETNIPGLENIRYVRFGGLQYIYEMSTAKLILSNQRTDFIVEKRKGQKYVQLWHSSAGLKKIEGDAEDYLPKQYIKLAKKDSKKTDIMVSGSQFNTERFRRAFWYEGKILNIGTPRNDILFNNESRTINGIKLNLGISLKDKVVLYAPTFRSSYFFDYNLFDMEEIKNSLTKKYGGNWVLLIKYHPNMLKDEEYDQKYMNAINVSNYEDIQELFLISDLMITDFSSAMFDYCLMMRPCLLFVPDLVQYYESERGLNFKLEELPFPIAKNMEELELLISKFDINHYQNNVKLFLEQIGSYESGSACKEFMNFIETI